MRTQESEVPKGRLTRVGDREFASVSLHLAFLDFPLSTHTEGHIISVSLRRISPPQLCPLSWAYLCGIFKKVAVPQYQAQQYDARGIFLAEKPIHKQLSKIGAIRRELEGKACPFCGGHTYQLVLRANMPPQGGGLFARCSQCQRPRALDKAFNPILWM